MLLWLKAVNEYCKNIPEKEREQPSDRQEGKDFLRQSSGY
jgi:hypothetical protein